MSVLSANSSQYVDYATSAANGAGVPVPILLGLIQKENSQWDPHAYGSQNNNGTFDYGLTQLNTAYYPTAINMTWQQQIDTTVGILKTNFSSFGNWYDALRAYNAGATGAANNRNASATYAQDIISTAQQLGYNPSNTNTNSNITVNQPYATSSTDAATGGGQIQTNVPLQPVSATLGDTSNISGLTNDVKLNPSAPTATLNPATWIPALIAGLQGIVNTTGATFTKQIAAFQTFITDHLIGFAIGSIGVLVVIYGIWSTMSNPQHDVANIAKVAALAA